MRKAANIYWLGVKELRSFLRDFVLLGLVVYSFSLAVTLQARSNSQELHNASIAIVDEDQSELSRRIAHAFFPPLFQSPKQIAEQDIIPAMNSGKFTFVVDIPPNFQRYVLAGRRPELQINVDATAMVQAGLGSGYAQQIISTEISDFVSRAEGTGPSPVNLDVAHRVQPQPDDCLVYECDGDNQQYHHAGDHSGRCRGRARARARDHGPSAGDAADAVRDRAIQSLGKWPRDRSRGGPFPLSGDAHDAWHSRRRLRYRSLC